MNISTRASDFSEPEQVMVLTKDDCMLISEFIERDYSWTILQYEHQNILEILQGIRKFAHARSNNKI